MIFSRNLFDYKWDLTWSSCSDITWILLSFKVWPHFILDIPYLNIICVQTTCLLSNIILWAAHVSLSLGQIITTVRGLKISNINTLLRRWQEVAGGCRRKGGRGGGVISKNMCTRSLSLVLPRDLFKEMFTRLESRPGTLAGATWNTGSACFRVIKISSVFGGADRREILDWSFT